MFDDKCEICGNSDETSFYKDCDVCGARFCELCANPDSFDVCDACEIPADHVDETGSVDILGITRRESDDANDQ